MAMRGWRLAGLLGVMAIGASVPGGAAPYEVDDLVAGGSLEAGHDDSALLAAWGLVADGRRMMVVARGSATLRRYDATGAAVGEALSVGEGTAVMTATGAARFVGRDGRPPRWIAAGSDGTLYAVAPDDDLDPAAPVVDQSEEGAQFTGVAVIPPAGERHEPRLLAADFAGGRVAVFDERFEPLALPDEDEAFDDPRLPEGYAPYNVAWLGGTVYVAYALRDDSSGDPIAGPGHGFVDAFDADGHLLRRVASRGHLDAPWALALAPAGFGDHAGHLLIGNTGDGRINAYDPARLSRKGRYHFTGALQGTEDTIEIAGLRALLFGRGAEGETVLYYTADGGSEEGGLLGQIRLADAGGDDDNGDADDDGRCRSRARVSPAE